MGNVHIVREKAEQLYQSLASMRDQLSKEIDALNETAIAELEGSEIAHAPVDAIIRSAETTEARMDVSLNRIRGLLAEWEMPEMPPLDLENVPAPIVYNPKGG